MTNTPKKLKWFSFRQNNSGGNFHVDDRVDINVIVQAIDADDANRIAEEIGIYFDGRRKGLDCSCCGDRWYAQWDNADGEDFPSIWGEPLTREDLNLVKIYPYGSTEPLIDATPFMKLPAPDED